MKYDAIKDKEGKAKDNYGHGTHLASIIGSRDKGIDRQYNGIAPGADLVIVKAFDKNGQGSYSNIIRGIAWVLENQDQYNIRVMNLSFRCAELFLLR